MRDMGLVTLAEPFANLLTQGMVLNHIYYRQPTAGRREYFNPAESWCGTTPPASAPARRC